MLQLKYWEIETQKEESHLKRYNNMAKSSENWS